MSHEDFHTEKNTGEKHRLYFHYKERLGALRAKV